MAEQRHSFFLRREPGRNSGGMRVLAACCPCGWTHMTAYPLFRKRSRARYLRHRWMEHTTKETAAKEVRFACWDGACPIKTIHWKRDPGCIRLDDPVVTPSRTDRQPPTSVTHAKGGESPVQVIDSPTA